MDQKRHSKNCNSGSIFKKFSASLTVLLLLASSNLTSAALANDQGGRGAAWQQFQIENPGLEKKELHQMFKQEWREIKGAGNGIGGGNDNAPNIQNQAIQNINNNVNNQIDRSDFASKAEWQAAKQALKLEQKSLSHNLNQTIQNTVNNKTININHGFSLDLTSAVESITLGDKLFQGQSVVINVGGEEKTVSAGSKVTAAEYVAARQALGGGAQTVTLDAQGRATGGEVDLSAMTSGNQTMKVKDLTVPVSVTASGDFGKGGDVRILGDLTNSGSINAYTSDNKNVNALIKADNITNNAGASITSSVSDLTLQADRNFSNYGDISATGNLIVSAGKTLTNGGSVSAQNELSILAPKVTNTGTLASAQGNVTLDTPIPAALKFNNNSGTISALNGAINIREAGYAASFDTQVYGGDLLSKELNVNAGGGMSDVFVNKLTGTVNSTGTGAHVSANTEVLTIGNQCLTGDPTYFNTGDIVLDGQINVGEAVSIIAGGNITATANLTQIIAREAGGQGFEINIVAGANITGGNGQIVGNLLPQTSIPPNINNNAVTPVTISGPNTNGGDIDLSGAAAGFSIRSSSTALGLDGGNIQIVAYRNNDTGGAVILPSDSVISSAAGEGGVNGHISIFGGNSVSIGTVSSADTVNTAGGNIIIANANPVFDFGNSMTFGTDGRVTSSNHFVLPNAPTWGPGNVTVASLFSFGALVANQIQSGHNLTIGGLLFSSGLTQLDAGLANSGNGNLTLTSAAISQQGLIANASGSIAATVLSSSTGDIELNANGNITTTDMIASLGSVTAIAVGNTTVGNVTAGNSITLGAGPQQFPAVNGHLVTGDLTANQISLLTPYGDVTINGTLNASQSFTLSVLGDIDQSFFDGSVFSTTQSIDLNSTIGSIGSALNPLLISTANITANAALGSVYINDLLSDPQVNVLGASGNVVQIIRANPGVSGGISVFGHIGANTVILSNSGANGEITIDMLGSIGGLGGGAANSVTLEGKGVGRVRSHSSALIDTIALNLSTGSGDIEIGNTTARSISAVTTTGNVLITDSSVSPVTINALSGRIVDVNLTTPGTGLVIANTITATESLRLILDNTQSTATITRTGANTTLISPEIRLEAGGNIGTTTTAILTDTDKLTALAGTPGPSGTARNIFISDSDAFAIEFMSGNIVNLSAVGSITNSEPNTQVRANTLNLSSTLGSIGELGVGTNGRINTNASSISAIAAGDVYLETTASLVQLGVLSGQVVDVNSVNGSRFNLLENITGTSSVSIHTMFNNHPLNAITQLAGKTIVTPTLSLSTTDGNIGTASNQIRTTAGVLDVNSNGNVFVTTTGDVSLNASSGDTFRLTSGGGITVQDDLLSNNLTLTSGNNGNIDLNWFIAGLTGPDATSVTLNANGSGSITQALGTNIRTTSLSLNSASGDIGASGSPITVNPNVTNVNLSVHTTGDWFVTAFGDVNLGASTGGNGTLVSNNVSTTGNTTLTGTLDITTQSLNVAGDKLAADIINVQGFSGGNLTIDGGLAGGIFASTTKTNWIATNGGSIFLSGDVTMNGDTFITTNAAGQVTINAGAQYIGNNLVKITSGLVNQIGFISGNPLVYNLLGNTILNSNGDVNFSDNIIFVGENFAVLASGNINFSPFSNIRLANSAGDGGNLTLVAGYNITPGTVGQIRSTAEYTLGGASATGGSINMGGTAFDLSGSNNGGTLTAVAQGQAGGNAGIVNLGAINTSGANNGGNVTVFGSGGISVGAINTTGGSASGNVLLSVENSQIVGGDIKITNGTRSGLGQFVSNGASEGNLSYGNITATGAQVGLTGALSAANTINGTGTIVANTLDVQTGAGVATIGNTQIATLNSDGNGTVSLSNIGNLVLNGIGGAGQSLTATATGSITGTNAFAIDKLNLTATAASGNTAISLTGASASTSASLKSNGGGNIIGDVSTNALTLNSSGNVGVNATTRFTTDAATIKVDAVNAFLNDTNALGVQFSSGTVSGTFNVLATGIVTGGTLTTSNAVITAAGIGTGTGVNAFSLTNGANPLSLEVQTGTGDSFINAIGTGVLQIVGGSTSNVFDVKTPNGASVSVLGDVTFGGDINITTNSMTNFFDVASTNGSINIQSNAGSDLLIFGATGPTPATYSAANGVINLTTNGTILGISGKTTYLTTANLIANVSGQSVVQQAGAVSTATVPSYVYTASATGGSFDGPWNFVNSGTYANNGGNVTLSSITFSGADIAVIASGDIQLNNVTINLSGNNGGNLTMMAGFNFEPNTFGQVDQDTSTTFQNFTPTSSGSILGTATINLNGAAGSGGRLIALANNGSVSLGDISSTGTVSGGDIAIIASNGITTGAITTTGPTGGAVDLIVGNPTVGAGTNFQILAGSIVNGLNTVDNVSLNNGSIIVGPVATGNGSFSAQTSATGAVTLQNALSARNISIDTGSLNLLGFSTIAAGTDGAGNAGDISISASAVTTPTSHLQVTAIGTGAGSGGNIDFEWNSTAAVALGAGASDKFDFQFNGTGDGGSLNFTSQGDITLNAGALVGNSTGAAGGKATVGTTGNLTVNANSINLGGTDGDGAEISLTAGLVDGVGTLNLADTSFLTQANGTGSNGDGGLLSLIGSNITYGATSAVSPLALTAAGSGTGNGGTIIFRTGDTTATFIGAPARAPRGAFHFLRADAHGDGNGGTIDIQVGGNLTISDTSLINASRGSSGNLDGANYRLEAGKQALANLIITGSLDATGLGSGVDGTVFLGTNSRTAFSVGSTNPKNGITGTVSGGEIQINNRAGGIQVLSAANLSAQRMNLTAALNGAISVVGTLSAAQSIVLTAGTGAIGGKGALAVNTASLQANTAGSVSLNNLFTGPSVLLDSTGGRSFTLHTAGSTTLNDISTTRGNITVVESAGALQVANGSLISANNGALILQNTDNAGTISIGDNATVRTFENGRQVSIVIGATVPRTGTNPSPPNPAGVNVTINNPRNFVWFGPNNAVNVPTGTAQVTSKNQNVLFSGLAAGTISLGNGSLVLADPPDRVGAASVAAAVPSTAMAVPVANSKTGSADLNQIFGFAGEYSNATADLSVLNMNAAVSAERGGALHAPNWSVGGSPTAGGMNAAPTMDSREDNSYMVGFMGNSFGESEAALCSDVELGVGRSAGFQPASENAVGTIKTIQHSDRVVIKKGNVLFVPFKATTVETPNGIVHIDAKSVALVSSTDAGLAVYDLEDQHKGSVSVESNGHNVVLAPGRHVMITKHHTAEFAQINAVETIAHRNVQSVVKNGHRAHTSEFSVLTAMDTVKPLKALASSKHAHARQIADRMMKTTAIILQLGGGSGGQYQHYFKPRMTAMQK